MYQSTNVVDVMRVVIPVLVALVFWIYLALIIRDIKESQSALKDRLWIDDPSQAEQSQLDRDLKKYISIKEVQAYRTKIFAILFTGMAIIFICITSR
ncbi:hypothetical protein FHW11_004343 [Pantoea agglomerans]|nr:hypothetical protein [Pantoea agglomerans]MBA8894291.1 hypothetical protein [Pantoea agglomerans]